MFSINFKFKKPQKVDILIYDRVGSEFIRRAIGTERTYGVLDVRKRLFSFYPLVLIRFIVIISQKIIFRFRRWESLSITAVAEFSIITSIKPKVVITFVDNSRRFNALSRAYREAKFIGVQNGIRGSEVEGMADYLCLTNFFCFGEETKDRYRVAGCNVERFIVGGSLKDGLYRQKYPLNTPKKYDICWISQYRPQRFSNTLPGLRSSSLVQLKYIQKYCNEQNKILAIACSCKERTFPYEYDFLLNELDLRNVVLVPNDDNNFSSYRLIDHSTLSITTSSTIGMEALSRGSKVLFCNFTDDEYYDITGSYGDGIWQLSGADIQYKEFVERVSEISELPRQQWVDLTREVSQYFVRVMEQTFPQDILAKEVESVFEKK